jgi:hypothetical protein
MDKSIHTFFFLSLVHDRRTKRTLSVYAAN